MQGRENDQASIVSRQSLNNLYPGSGYSTETGGLMKELRTLTHETVQAYHQEFYRPDNLCLIITGNIGT